MTPLIREVFIRNYKSIARARVSLEPFTALVGPNGSGKSNFIDCLAFVNECLSDSIWLAFKNRGGIGAVRRYSGGHPTHIEVQLALELGQGATAQYGFEIAAKPPERFTVSREKCMVQRVLEPEAGFEVRNGRFTKPIEGIRPKVTADRLALFAASATPEFRPVYDFLTSMRFYSGVPARLRELQDPDPGEFLKRDGSNAAAVLKRLMAEPNGKERYQRLCRLLSKIVDGLRGVDYSSIGQKETLEFKQDVGQKHPWRFGPLNISDGTLRILGLLLAVHQPGDPTVVAIEEPEQTVHPAVAELIVEVLLNAARERQVLVTTHSPDILDHEDIGDDQIRVVRAEKNRTSVCPLSASSRQAVREQLYTPGELLRAGELNPDRSQAQPDAQPRDLFASGTTDHRERR